MNIEPKTLLDILLKQNYITADDAQKAQAFSEAHHVSVEEYLFSEGLMTKALLGQAIAEACGVPYADLAAHQPDREQVLQLPEDVAKKYRAVIFASTTEGLTVATDNPQQADLLPTFQTYFPNKQIKLTYTLPEDIDETFSYYRQPLGTRFVQIIESQKRIAPEILDQIIEDTLAYRASDIHFEPQEKEVVIRFRIDGVLHEAGRILKEYYENIVNRIKVQSNLRIDEHKACQDGAIRLSKKDKIVDLRVSIAPTLDGEKIALRILSEYVRGFTITDLGLTMNNQKLLLDSAKKPFGMILVVGPTGSGKTTTLYSLIKILKRPEINITTIEDPVEYKILGINQMQVNPETGLTFADGLRSIARQDPDIILVGEIRDKETAEIAVNAALTGHLLLSTFHANDAATAIPRLLDMGVEPFLMASSLEVIIAQRLVRRICSNCRYSYTLSPENFKDLPVEIKNYLPDQTTVYAGKGCNTCNHTGFKGRTAIFEFIHITPEMQDMILRNPAIKQIWELARQQGSKSMFEDGIEKVKSGITTLKELLRIVQIPMTSTMASTTASTTSPEKNE